mgnify:CR=1 FL=1
MNTGINLNIAGVEFDNDAEFALTFSWLASIKAPDNYRPTRDFVLAVKDLCEVIKMEGPFACIGLDNAFLNKIDALQTAFTELDYPECQPIIDLIEANKAFEIEPDYGNDSIGRCQKMLNDKFKNL